MFTEILEFRHTAFHDVLQTTFILVGIALLGFQHWFGERRMRKYRLEYDDKLEKLKDTIMEVRLNRVEEFMDAVEAQENLTKRDKK